MEKALERLALAIENGLTAGNLLGDTYGIPESLQSIASAIKQLGNADASTPMGGLEALWAAMLKCSEMISGSLSDVALSLEQIAEAIEDQKPAK